MTEAGANTIERITRDLIIPAVVGALLRPEPPCPIEADLAAAVAEEHATLVAWDRS